MSKAMIRIRRIQYPGSKFDITPERLKKLGL